MHFYPTEKLAWAVKWGLDDCLVIVELSWMAVMAGFILTVIIRFIHLYRVRETYSGSPGSVGDTFPNVISLKSSSQRWTRALPVCKCQSFLQTSVIIYYILILLIRYFHIITFASISLLSTLCFASKEAAYWLVNSISNPKASDVSHLKYIKESGSAWL